ncbi:MAG: rhodanese-like domain-containing protein [Comamonadaceae bacterium]|nr:rhodanese-like domain-containing protein [Comamonadaceae bacterium]
MRKAFFTMINQLHHAHEHLLLCICNSGRRSLTAASLLRSLGYPKALSVAGGFRPGKVAIARCQRGRAERGTVRTGALPQTPQFARNRFTSATVRTGSSSCGT